MECNDDSKLGYWSLVNLESIYKWSSMNLLKLDSEI